jgi:ribonuclease E
MTDDCRRRAVSRRRGWDKNADAAEAEKGEEEAEVEAEAEAEAEEGDEEEEEETAVSKRGGAAVPVSRLSQGGGERRGRRQEGRGRDDSGAGRQCPEGQRDRLTVPARARRRAAPKKDRKRETQSVKACQSKKTKYREKER